LKEEVMLRGESASVAGSTSGIGLGIACNTICPGYTAAT
jgi:hypothetical protein